MQVTIILGSRNPNGQTAQAAQALLKGVVSAGGTGQEIYLPEMAIERCRQCEDNGWGTCRTEGRCIIKDDLAGIIDKIEASDAVAFATPVYFSDLSESMRAFLDRLRRTTRHPSGKARVEGKPAIGICVAGGGGGGAPACTVTMDKVLRTCGFDTVDLVPLRRQNLDMKRNLLQLTGQWLTQLSSKE